VQRIETSLPDVWELRPTVISDARGTFMETYHQRKFADLGITDTFVQDNHSRSVKHTLRGFHYQLRHPQAKLCRVIEGEAFDVALDIRVGSPHFGKWAAVVLSAKERNELYIPAGFAHAFLALSETMQFLYKCSDFYDPADENGVLWADPELGIPWESNDPLVSERDAKFARLANIPAHRLPRFCRDLRSS
jgi:dTDP-4-dehydrorhamnose 3,5-epimerase